MRLNLIEEKERPGLYADHVLKEKTRRFYLIVASFEHRKNAGDFILRLKKKGFYDAKIIVENDKFRISLKDFAALRDAKAMRINTVLSEFEDAWILQY